MILNDHFFEEREAEKNLKEGLLWILLREVYASIQVIKRGRPEESCRTKKVQIQDLGYFPKRSPSY